VKYFVLAIFKPFLYFLIIPKKDASQLLTKLLGKFLSQIRNKGKNGHAVAFGRLGGLKGGIARAEGPTLRSAKIAAKAAKKRWVKALLAAALALLS
jgi:hypothetical protein